MAGAAGPLWLARPSRFAPLGRRAALAVLALVLLAVAAALLPPRAAPAAPTAPAAPGLTDVGLYATVIAAVRAGEPYYEATARTLRRGDYPLRPFLTFRQPLHSWVQAALPPAATIALLYALAAGVVAAWWVRLRGALASPIARAAAMLLLAGGMIAFVQPGLVPMHEIWAGLLIALSLALWRPGRWTAALAVALLAMLVRETAAGLALVMLVMALVERRRGEALAWAGALLLFAAALAAHGAAVAAVVRPDDPLSAGWMGLLGPGFAARAVMQATALAVLPALVVLPLVALAGVGWTAWDDPAAPRIALAWVGYAAALALLARADTFYWVLMIAPTSLVGLVFVPDAIRDLARACLDSRRAPALQDTA